MLINRKNIFTLSLAGILGLSGHAFAGKGNGNSSQSGASSHTAMDDMNRTRPENTLRHKKQQGEKPEYQHQYQHTHKNTHQNTQGNSVNSRSPQSMSDE